MDTVDIITILWLIAGIILSISELLIPGLFVIFLGIAAILIAGMRWLGILEGDFHSFSAWAGTSLVLVLVGRGIFQRWFPSETSFEDTDEDKAAIGQSVEVVETVTTRGGRIRYQGSTWDARTKEDSIPAQSRARIVSRDNISWIVEPERKGKRNQLGESE